MNTTFVRELSGGRQRLWKLSEPLKYKNGLTSFVVTSTPTPKAMGMNTFGISVGPKTYIFAADENGKVLDWIELPGSFRGGHDHERAIRQFCESVPCE